MALLPYQIPILCLCLVLSMLMVQGFDFLKIDCGSNQPFRDARSLSWVGDQDFVQSGEARTVPGFNLPGRPELKTLRVFEWRKKNCYTIPVNSETKILVRAYFYYGNYDSKNNPPQMDVLFDATHWITIATTLNGILSTEIIYVTRRNSTSICVARTKPNQDPFISAIEFRTLTSDMYDGVDSTKALRNYVRYAYGASRQIRYPDDNYDRLWNPMSQGYTILKSDTTIPSITLDDAPPKEAFRSAVGPPYGTSVLTIPFSFLPQNKVPICYYMYYTEISNPRITGKLRSFTSYIDGTRAHSYEDIFPPYQSVSEWYSCDRKLSAASVYSLRPTSTSTLPPIISAMEVFLIIDVNPGTRPSDVKGLSTLQRNFEILKEWSGDPCLPVNTKWEWIKCNTSSSSITPSITQLILAGYGLKGSLPDFSALTDLEFIDLHDNSLDGAVPEFFNKFKKLKKLNLAHNKFTSVPASLLNNKNIELQIEGNTFNTPPPPPNEANKATATLFSLIFLGLLCLM